MVHFQLQLLRGVLSLLQYSLDSFFFKFCPKIKERSFSFSFLDFHAIDILHRMEKKRDLHAYFGLRTASQNVLELIDMYMTYLSKSKGKKS